MTTTIQVSNEVKQVLEVLKEQEHSSSYDDVIKHLIKTHTHIGKSMFGAIKGMKWAKEDRLNFHDA